MHGRPCIYIPAYACLSAESLIGGCGSHMHWQYSPACPPLASVACSSGCPQLVQQTEEHSVSVVTSGHHTATAGNYKFRF